MSMDVTILFSPTHGFWSEHGWSDHISQATRLPLMSSVQISFKKVRDIRRIRLGACQRMSHLELMRFALSMMSRNNRPLLLQAFCHLYRCEHLPDKDDQSLASLCSVAPIALLGRLVSEHSHYDVYAGERLDDVIMVPRDHAEPVEKAPLVPPFIEPYQKKEKNRAPSVLRDTRKPLIGRTQGKLVKQ